MAPSADEIRETGLARPFLAVCIATHHGRAGSLSELLERLVPQVPKDGSVEVCISDNASRDGTEELVAAHRRRLGDRLRYRRNERNLGLVPNMFGVIELASAEYCWFLGSDDAPAAGAVTRLVALLREHPGVSGANVALRRRGQDDLEDPGVAFPPNFQPPVSEPRELRSERDFVCTCGMSSLALSSVVIHRERWLSAAASERARAEKRNPNVPQMGVIGRMVKRDPSWTWTEQVLGLSRAAPVYLEEELGPDVGVQMLLITRELDRVWADLHGRRSDLHRMLMDRFREAFWRPAAVAAMIAGSQGRIMRLRYLESLRHFWWSGPFRREVVPLLLVPGSRLQRPAQGTRPEQFSAAIDGSLPERLLAGAGTWIKLEVENRGGSRLSFAGPGKLVAAETWKEAESGISVPVTVANTPLYPPLAPGRRRQLRHWVSVPEQPGRYELSVDLIALGPDWSATGDAPVTGTVSVELPSV